MNYINLLGYVGGFLVVVSLLPQVIKGYKTKSTKDISLWRYIIYTIGLIVWIVYAVLIGNGPVALTNCLGLILAVLIIRLKLKYG